MRAVMVVLPAAGVADDGWRSRAGSMVKLTPRRIHSISAKDASSSSVAVRMREELGIFIQSLDR